MSLIGGKYARNCSPVFRLAALSLCACLLTACYRSAEEAERLREALEEAQRQEVAVEISPQPVEAPPAAPEPAPREPAAVAPPASPETIAQPPETTVWTDQRLAQVRAGLGPSEVARILGSPGVPVTGAGGEAAVYRWRNEEGLTVIARFEDDRLVRRTVRTPRAEEEPEADDERDLAAEDNGEEPAEPEETAEEEAEDVLPPLDVTPEPELADAQPDAPEAQVEAVEGELRPRHPGVRVARDPRLAAPEVVTTAPGEAAAAAPPASSYRPRARLPRHTMSLRRGTFEVRLTNEGETTVRAGLRSGDRGRDVVLAPGRSRSVFVNQGGYSLHFIDEADPYTVHRGPDMQIDAMFAADLDVRIADGQGSVSPLLVDPGDRVVRR